MPFPRLKLLKLKAPGFFELELEPSDSGKPQLNPILRSTNPERTLEVVEQIEEAVSVGDLKEAVARLLVLAREPDLDLRRQAVLVSSRSRDVDAIDDGQPGSAVAAYEERQRLLEEAYGISQIYSARLKRAPAAPLAQSKEGEPVESHGMPSPQPVIVCDGIGRRVRRKVILEPTDFGISAGEIVGVAGRNGAGKTTFLELVSRRRRPSSGSVVLHPGQARRYRHREYLDRVAYLPQERSSIGGRVGHAMSRYLATRGVVGGENEDQVEYYSALLGLTDHMDKLWSELSSGYQARFELALALLGEPELVILDEPLSALDHPSREKYLQLLTDMARYSATAVVVSAQDLLSLDRIADTVLVIDDGRVAGRYRPGSRHPGAELMFEIVTESSLPEVRTALEGKLDDLEVSKRLGHIRITARASNEDEKILGLLIDAGVRLRYFNDLSGSARLALEEQ